MGTVELKKMKGLKGEVMLPPDKSISHRAVMFASLAKGKSVVRNFLRAEDPVSTMNAFKALGVTIEEGAGARGKRRGARSEVTVYGNGPYELKEPFDVIDCGNSGTTARLITGVLAGSSFFSVLTGDDSLRQRPMPRVIQPLREMSADISGRSENKYLPIAIRGKALRAIQYSMPVASAQVKSCLLLAGLFANGTTSITEPYKSRDHTERMLKAMGAGIEIYDLTVSITGGSKLSALELSIPSDFSSAAFFIAAALIVPGSEIVMRNVGVNPTRTGLLDVLRDMGAALSLQDARDVSGEPVADICCRTAGRLKAVKIGREKIPSVIDEFPILCVLATQAEGTTEIRGAEELRVKESDRIRAMATELRKLGVELEEYPDGIAIQGRADLQGCPLESYGDHRIAMSLAVAALVAGGRTTIRNASCVDISFPGFFEKLGSLNQ